MTVTLKSHESSSSRDATTLALYLSCLGLAKQRQHEAGALLAEARDLYASIPDEWRAAVLAPDVFLLGQPRHVIGKMTVPGNFSFTTAVAGAVEEVINQAVPVGATEAPAQPFRRGDRVWHRHTGEFSCIAEVVGNKARCLYSICRPYLWHLIANLEHAAAQMSMMIQPHPLLPKVGDAVTGPDGKRLRVEEVFSDQTARCVWTEASSKPPVIALLEELTVTEAPAPAAFAVGDRVRDSRTGDTLTINSLCEGLYGTPGAYVATTTGLCNWRSLSELELLPASTAHQFAVGDRVTHPRYNNEVLTVQLLHDNKVKATCARANGDTDFLLLSNLTRVPPRPVKDCDFVREVQQGARTGPVMQVSAIEAGGAMCWWMQPNGLLASSHLPLTSLAHATAEELAALAAR